MIEKANECVSETGQKSQEKTTLSAAEIRVGLPGVTFLDAQCAREAVIRSFPHGGRLTLCDPSQEAHRSLQACAKGLPDGYLSKTGNYENGGYEWT